MRTVICHKYGCECTSVPGKHFCQAHIAMEDTYGKRPTPDRKQSRQWHNLYSLARWKRERKEFLKKYPLCCRCGEPATIVDHIKPHRGNYALFFDHDNWQPLCWRCHGAKTLAENKYFKKDDGQSASNLSDYII